MPRPHQLNANPWTSEEDDTIRLACSRGQSAQDIESRLQGRSVRAIQNRAKRLSLVLPLRPRIYAKPSGLDGEIIRICGYISSDSTIANYMGVSVELVAKLRRRTPAQPIGERRAGRPRTEIEDIPISMDADRRAYEAARNGSQALWAAMYRSYRKVAREHGVTVEQAMRICLSGQHAPTITTTKGENHE